MKIFRHNLAFHFHLAFCYRKWKFVIFIFLQCQLETILFSSHFHLVTITHNRQLSMKNLTTIMKSLTSSALSSFNGSTWIDWNFHARFCIFALTTVTESLWKRTEQDFSFETIPRDSLFHFPTVYLLLLHPFSEFQYDLSLISYLIDEILSRNDQDWWRTTVRVIF